MLKKLLSDPFSKQKTNVASVTTNLFQFSQAYLKILEKIINSRFIKYLEANNLLSDNQFGLRPNKTTNSAVNRVTNYIIDNMDKNLHSIGIFLDLAMPYDTNSRTVLLYELEKLGIKGTQLALFKDYLRDRTQCVKIGLYTSSDHNYNGYSIF